MSEFVIHGGHRLHRRTHLQGFVFRALRVDFAVQSMTAVYYEF